MATRPVLYVLSKGQSPFGLNVAVKILILSRGRYDTENCFAFQFREIEIYHVRKLDVHVIGCNKQALQLNFCHIFWELVSSFIVF